MWVSYAVFLISHFVLGFIYVVSADDFETTASVEVFAASIFTFGVWCFILKINPKPILFWKLVGLFSMLGLSIEIIEALKLIVAAPNVLMNFEWMAFFLGHDQQNPLATPLLIAPGCIALYKLAFESKAPKSMAKSMGPDTIE